MIRTYWLAVMSTCGMALLMGCVPLRPQEPRILPHGIVTRRDSVEAAWGLAYAYVRAVDHYARPRGELPRTLGPVVETGEAGPDVDVWGRNLQYRPDGLRFEVRSGGSDGLFETNDDIVALGQVGRDRPCEMRSEFAVTTGVGFEPPCAIGLDVVVLPRCPQLTRGTHLDDEIPPTHSDSVLVMGLRLVRIARGIDGIGRDLGGLPLSLRPVPSFSKLDMEAIGDIWRRPVRYHRQDRDFEVRSAGPDGEFDTDDDIAVNGQLGQTLPCAFRTSRGMVTCNEPPPPCP
jgi:hypothetical protein